MLTVIRISIAEAGRPARLLTFSKADVVVGRTATHDLCLGGQGVSGTHCRFMRRGETMLIEDLGSTNGTFVNRQRIAAPTAVTSSDEIVIAIYRVQVLSDEDSGVKLRPTEASGGGGAVVVGRPPAAGPTAAHPTAGVPTHRAPSSSSSPPSSAATASSQPAAIPKTRVGSRADLAWGRQWEQIDRLATEWLTRGRPRGGLLAGPELARARAWLAQGRGKQPQPTTAHRQFIDAGARRRRIRILGRITGAVAIVGVGATAVVLATRGAPVNSLPSPVPTNVAGGEGSEPPSDPDLPLASTAEHIAETSLKTVTHDPQLAALLAVAAAASLRGADAVRPDHRAAQALRASLAQITGRRLIADVGPIAAVAISPEGRFVATSTTRRGEPIRLWDVTVAGRGRPALLSNHAGRVTQAAMTNDGRWLVTADDDGLVMRWDLTVADPPSSGVRLDAHTTKVEALAVQGTWAVTADASGQVQLWDLAAAIPRGTPLPGHTSPVTGLAMASDLSLVAATAEDGSGRIWTIAAGRPQRRVAVLSRPEAEGSGPLLSVALSPDGTWALTGASDGTAWLWAARSMAPARGAPPPLAGKHRGAITNVGFSHDGAVAYTGGKDDKINLWSMTAADPGDKVIPWMEHTGDIVAVEVTGPLAAEPAPTDGVAYLVSASRDGTARRWNLDRRDGAVEVEVLEPHDGPIRALDVSADGRWAVTGGEDGVAIVSPLWRAERVDRRRVPGLGAAQVGFGHTGPVRALGLAGGGSRLVTSSDDGTARVWDLSQPHRLDALAVLGGHTGPVRALAVRGDSRYVATGSTGGELRLWDLSQPDPGEQFMALPGHTQEIRGLAFTDATLVSVSTDGTARLWDMEVTDPRGSARVLDHGDEIVAAAVSGDGRWLLSATGTELKALLWDLRATDPAATQRALRGRHGDALTAVAIGPLGRWAATGARDYRVHLHDLHDEGAKPTKLRHHEGEISALAFSPDGRWLATGDGRGAVVLWDVTAEHPDERGRALTGPSSGIYGLAWAGNSGWLVAASGDRSVTMWRVDGDGPQDAPPIVLEGHEGVVSAVAITGDGRTVVSGGFDGTARVWPLGAEALTPIACARVGRWLTAEEWSHDIVGPYQEHCAPQ